jgi:hypothetical protein
VRQVWESGVVLGGCSNGSTDWAVGYQKGSAMRVRSASIASRHSALGRSEMLDGVWKGLEEIY